jgi:hypothetical protein
VRDLIRGIASVISCGNLLCTGQKINS